MESWGKFIARRQNQRFFTAIATESSKDTEKNLTTQIKHPENYYPS